MGLFFLGHTKDMTLTCVEIHLPGLFPGLKLLEITLEDLTVRGGVYLTIEDSIVGKQADFSADVVDDVIDVC